MNHEELIAALKQLHLQEIALQYPEISKLAEKEKKTYEEYLAKLAEVELNAKYSLRVRKLIHEAKFPIQKTIETFDFDARTGITPQQFNRLATGEFIRQAGNVVFYGSFGVGKSHLATALTLKLCQAGFKCLFSSTSALIDQLVQAKTNSTLASTFKRLDRFDLIYCDELGYVPQDPIGADLFFQLISQRAERKSILITTNLTYSEWNKVFIHPMTTNAAVDRVIYNCETYTIKGPSWREMTAAQRMQKQGDPDLTLEN